MSDAFAIDQEPPRASVEWVRQGRGWIGSAGTYTAEVDRHPKYRGAPWQYRIYRSGGLFVCSGYLPTPQEARHSAEVEIARRIGMRA